MRSAHARSWHSSMIVASVPAAAIHVISGRREVTREVDIGEINLGGGPSPHVVGSNRPASGPPSNGPASNEPESNGPASNLPASIRQRGSAGSSLQKRAGTHAVASIAAAQSKERTGAAYPHAPTIGKARYAARVRSFVFLVFFASTAYAQEDAYRARIAQAVAEFDARRFEEARALFRSAHEISPNARTLRGIGLASFELSDYPEAYRSLSAALTDTRQPLTPEQTAEVQALLERTRAFVGAFRIAVTPEGALVEIDGATREPEPDGRVLLTLGAHTITARAPGHLDRTHEVRVNGGEDETIELALELVVDARPPPLPRPSPSDPTAAIALLVTGGAAALASIALGSSWWLYQQNELDACVGDCFNGGDVASARDAAIATTLALGGVGAALLVAGAILLGTSSTQSAVHCAPGVIGVMCGGAF